MPLAFHQRAQRSVDRRRDARQQRRLFARENLRLRRSSAALLRLLPMISQKTTNFVPGLRNPNAEVVACQDKHERQFDYLWAIAQAQ